MTSTATLSRLERTCARLRHDGQPVTFAVAAFAARVRHHEEQLRRSARLAAFEFIEIYCLRNR